MNKEPIKLDEYDSQILLLSKGRFDDELKDLGKTDVEALKALWAWRCAVSIENVEERYVVSHLIGMLENLGKLNKSKVLDILDSVVIPGTGWMLGVPEGATSVEAIICSCLGILSQTQVRDTIYVDGEEVWEDLVELYKMNRQFLDIFYEKEEEV